MSNPYLAEWRRLHGSDAPYGNYWSHEFNREEVDRQYEAYKLRRELCARYSFAVPSEEALDLIASYGPVVEVGAGIGYWARLLRERGCDVVAYDLLESAFAHWFPNAGAQPEGVTRGDGAVVATQHADRTLFICWPPYNGTLATDALAAYEKAGGRRLVYVGEGVGGCCADDAFFRRLGEECYHYEEETCEHAAGPWKEAAALYLPQWAGIHDSLTVYERTNT